MNTQNHPERLHFKRATKVLALFIAISLSAPFLAPKAVAETDRQTSASILAKREEIKQAENRFLPAPSRRFWVDVTPPNTTGARLDTPLPIEVSQHQFDALRPGDKLQILAAQPPLFPARAVKGELSWDRFAELGNLCAQVVTLIAIAGAVATIIFRKPFVILTTGVVVLAVVLDLAVLQPWWRPRPQTEVVPENRTGV